MFMLPYMSAHSHLLHRFAGVKTIQPCRLERERRIGDFEVLRPRGGCGRASFEARAPLES